jgi:hypothetical protein
MHCEKLQACATYCSLHLQSVLREVGSYLDAPEGTGEEVDRAEEHEDELDNAHARERNVQILGDNAVRSVIEKRHT